MTVIRFPKRRQTASAELRNSTLAKPAQRLEAKVVVDGPLAETITLGQAQVTPADFIIRSLHALFGGGHAA